MRWKIIHPHPTKENIATSDMERRHYVLIHGCCHGSWSWFKVKPILESAGHLVTVLDLAASGANSKHIDEVDTLSEYSEPLLEFLASLPPDENVVLVGHSFGGLSVALAMDKFPEKVAVGVFLAAFMPDTQHKPSYVLEKYNEDMTAEAWLDTKFSPSGSKTSIFFGPLFLSANLYQLCYKEDLQLGKTKIRPGCLFIEDLSKAQNFSEEGYGSVPRVFIVCKQDRAIPLKHQLWMIQNSGVENVVEIDHSDHMAMLCEPHEVCDALLHVARQYT